MRQIAFIFVVFALLLSGGCNEFNRIQKKGSQDEKYEKALEYYGKGDFVKAQMLLDELYPQMRTTAKAENIAYHLAFCNYNIGDYIMAGYQFRSYFRSFPLSPRAEECLYMSAYCHYLNSPPFSLDQTDTYQAIQEFQYFIQQFPNSKRIPECNKLIDKMYEKLQKKEFLIARQYLKIGDYKAALTAFEQLIKTYPATPYREEAMYLSLEARYQLALNSIDTKKEQRIKDTITEYQKFNTAFPVSPFSGDAKKIYDNTLQLQKDFQNQQKTN
ncbi:MAG: outer membrane protein assembly factor BamD [Bacteroidia bacterium]|jgi:outer membrane protein assembly factor BamD|nr:outer membrane protein assembly factor BamD [Bacteroidia bacterium]